MFLKFFLDMYTTTLLINNLDIPITLRYIFDLHATEALYNFDKNIFIFENVYYEVIASLLQYLTLPPFEVLYNIYNHEGSTFYYVRHPLIKDIE